MARHTDQIRTPGSAVLLCLTCLLTLMLWSNASHARTTASVDRAQIALDESFQLTISINESNLFSGPNLSVLENDFRILGRSQNSRHYLSNGSSESTTEWLVTLKPKRTGTLEIPPITVKNEQTDPITITVSETAPSQHIQGKQIFVEAEFDQQQAYVQSQLIFTLRLYSAVALVDLNVETPQIPQAFVEKLQDATYEKTVNGQRYGVYEVRFAVFPQTSGELLIPPVLFSASVPQRRRGGFFDPFGAQGQAVRLRSPESSIDILEPPANFNGKHWLPAAGLQLQESWSADPATLSAGDSLTRTITISAAGLMAEQLPPLPELQLKNVKIYPDQPTTDTQKSADGVSSTRIESVAILPTKGGSYQLPEMRIQWWDVQADRMREATLPARTLQVKPSVEEIAQSAANKTEPVKPAADTSENEQDKQKGQTAVPTASGSTDVVWIIICAVLAGGWLITALLYWRLHWRLHKIVHHAASSNSASTGKQNLHATEKPAWQTLREACRANDARSTRQALLGWANIFWKNDAVNNLDDIIKLANSEQLMLLLKQLDQHIYGALPGATPSDWNGELLFGLLGNIRGSAASRQQKPTDLQPLYPIS